MIEKPVDSLAMKELKDVNGKKTPILPNQFHYLIGFGECTRFVKTHVKMIYY